MKPFSWSWSKLKNYRTCPKRHYEIDLAKNYREADNENLKWGNAVHDAMAKFIDTGKPLPTMMERYEAWPKNVAKLKAMGFETKCEVNSAIDKDFRASSWFDAGTWFRAKIDVEVLLPQFRAAITVDWKTGGKVQPEFEQLALSAQTVFSNHPEIDEVAAIYVWFGHDTQTIKSYRREDMAKIWNDLWPMIKVMEDAYKTTTYEAKPSGLCKSYCPVTSCPFHGKGSPR